MHCTERISRPEVAVRVHDFFCSLLRGDVACLGEARRRSGARAGKAFGTSDNRGKMLRRDGFTLAEERYGACCFPRIRTPLCVCVPNGSPYCACILYTAGYKPILEEVERILAEAGLDEEEMRKGAAAGPHNPSGQSRNRR